jgi:hypothetical protein
MKTLTIAVLDYSSTEVHIFDLPDNFTVKTPGEEVDEHLESLGYNINDINWMTGEDLTLLQHEAIPHVHYSTRPTHPNVISAAEIWDNTPPEERAKFLCDIEDRKLINLNSGDLPLPSMIGIYCAMKFMG